MKCGHVHSGALILGSKGIDQNTHVLLLTAAMGSDLCSQSRRIDGFSLSNRRISMDCTALILLVHQQDKHVLMQS